MSPGTVFYKMTGSGNDFVMLDGRYTVPSAWPPDRIARTCDRRMGVGADGLVILTPEPLGPIRMQYWNRDGSLATMCGNAALCTTRLSAYLELAQPDLMILRTDAGDVRTRCSGPEHLAEICLPGFPVPKRLEIVPGPGESEFYLSTVGVPHLVVLTDKVAKVDVLKRGRELRYHPLLGPTGANVNFVSPSADGADGPWLIRTYERGVEDETLACGTGTVAAAVSVQVAGLRRLPGDWQAGSGVLLAVAGTIVDDRVEEAWLCGEGRLVYTGILG
jgi:diaminopimelate epimerase